MQSPPGLQRDTIVLTTKMYVPALLRTVSLLTTLQHHWAFQKVMRKFVDENLYPDAQALQEKGKKPSQKVLDEFARLNIHAVRLGPGEHLKGRVIMDGAVKSEEVRK
jgi:hypothetical protein